MQLQVQVFSVGEETDWNVVRRSLTKPRAVYLPKYLDVREAEEVHIVGAGPAGLFAAQRLLERV